MAVFLKPTSICRETVWPGGCLAAVLVLSLGLLVIFRWSPCHPLVEVVPRGPVLVVVLVVAVVLVVVVVLAVVSSWTFLLSRCSITLGGGGGSTLT